jgi:transposase
MLIMGQCSDLSVAEVAQQFGYCRQRYYQLLAAYSEGGSSALQPQRTGPKSNYRRTPELVRRVIAQRFVDPDCSTEVIAQKIRQQQSLPISQRSVQRIIADYGLQKKTLRP